MKRLIAIHIILIVVFFYSCKEKNQALELYYSKSNLINNGSSRKPEFSIADYTNPNNVYHTDATLFLNDSIYTGKVLLHLINNKFIAKVIEPETNEFVLFDLDADVNKNVPIVIEYNKKINSFECRLEKTIIIDNGLKVYIYTIKDWGKTPFFKNKFLDIKLFVTRKYGVIGSYFTMNFEGKKIMFGVAGDILENYIDYSDTEKVTLK